MFVEWSRFGRWPHVAAGLTFIRAQSSRQRRSHRASVKIAIQPLAVGQPRHFYALQFDFTCQLPGAGIPTITSSSRSRLFPISRLATPHFFRRGAPAGGPFEGIPD
jgi:hypothetical protein